MQALMIRGSLALLLAGSLAVSAAGAAWADEASDATGSPGEAAVDASDTGSETARNGNGNCVNRFGRDFARAFQRGPNSEPLDADNVDLTLRPQAEPIDAC